MISVLYVDDERALLEVGRIFLEKEGEFTVGIALSAKAALESPDFSSYDIIVSDYQMPGMDGIAFLKHLRASGNTIPFILFTGKGREEVVIEAINNGADFYLQKGGQPQAQFAELAHKIRLAVRKRKTETDLTWSEEKFSRLFRENPSLEAITDFSTGSLIDVNDAFIRTTGYTRDEVIGRSARELGIFIDHQDRERMADAIAKDGIIRNIETRIQTKNGEIRVLDFTGQHIRIADRDILFSQAVDITDRRRAEEALKKKNEELNASYEQIAAAQEELRSQLDELTQKQAALMQSEEKYRELADLLPQMLFEIDREFRIIYINHYALSLFRITENELESGVTIFDFIAPEDHDKVRQNAARITGTGPVVAGQYTAVRRDSSRFPVLVYASPVFQHETLTGFRGVVMDISGQKSLEDELRNREATFRKIFEMSPYPAAINSVPDYKFVAINKAFVEASGFTEEEVLGKNHLELGIISIPEAAKLIARFAISNKLENVPLALTAKNGKRVHVIFSTVPITFENRPAILTITAEVTELRRIEEELIRKNEELHAAFEQLSATQEELNQNYSELTKNEQAIRASEAKFRALIEHTLDGILITDFTGNFYFVNRAACTIVDVDDPGVVIGKRNVMEFIAPESRDEVMRDFAKVAQGIDAYLALYKLITDRKREVWIESIGKKIPYGQGEAILISIRDVTGRKKAESAIQAMVRSMVGTTGDDSLKKITESVSAWLNSDCVMVGEIQPDRETVNVLSMILDGKDVPDFTYTLKGTPCENVEKKGFCLYPDNAIQLFPASKDLVELNIRGYVGTPLRNSRGEVMGVLCALSRAPLQPSPAMREIMDIIAVKAAAEIERGRVERALRESESKLRRLA